jgi:hypothetical protein
LAGFSVNQQRLNKIFTSELSQAREPSPIKDPRNLSFEHTLSQRPAIASLNKERNYFFPHTRYGEK